MWRVPEPSKSALARAARGPRGVGVGASGGSSGKPVAQWRQLQQALAKLLVLPGASRLLLYLSCCCGPPAATLA